MQKNKLQKTIQSPIQQKSILTVLKLRFEKNSGRHKDIDWITLESALLKNTDKLWTLNEMEKTGGEPDFFGKEKKSGLYVFMDYSLESPIGRRSVCFDREGLESRKEHKPKNNALDMAEEMGMELLSEAEYRELQMHGQFDAKTSSWIKTPDEIRKLGGALFADFRYGKVFVYHNGAQSYYAARGFRGLVKV